MSDEQSGEGARGATRVVEPTRAQAQLARRVAETRATVPDLTLRLLIDVEEALGGGHELIDVALHATARALRAHPHVNGAYRDGRFEQYARVNVGVVVDTPDGQLAPTLFDADTLTVAEIADRRRALTAKARAAELASPDLRGQTFTVAALDVDAFTPPVGAGHAAALAVGAPSPRAIAVDGRVEIRRVAELTLVCDHRILYGDAAAAFLRAVQAATAASFS